MSKGRPAAPDARGTRDSDSRSRDSRDSDVLRAALAQVQQQLMRATRGEHGPTGLPGGAPDSALQRIVQRCGLSPFETQVLLLAAAMELQPGFGALCARAAGDDQRPWPSFSLALATLPAGHWDALLPTAPLRALQLVELEPGPVLTERPLRLPERVLHALLGFDELDPRLARRLRPSGGGASGDALADAVPDSHRPQVQAMVAAWAASPRLAVHVQAERSGEAGATIARAARQAGLRASRLAADDVPVDPAERADLGGLLDREACLADILLVVDLDATVDPARRRAAQELLERAAGPVVGLSRDPLPDAGAAWLRLRLPAASWEERRHLWKAALQGLPAPTDAQLDDLVARFELDGGRVGELAASLRLADTDAAPADVLWQAARAASRPALEDLAQRIELRTADPDRLVLPDAQRQVLDAVIAQVRHKARVHHRWGLSSMGPRGAGTSAVFSGPSGTGKTMAAEIVARQLDLDLFRIDLSAVVSKYIGETEKNLRRVFDAAEAGGAVLLFDEADALFGKRTEVKDSHDRHANIEVSYLLQRMEAYGGLAILTTNFRKAIDDAFLRRIQFVVEFPFPEADQRERIWRGIFPPGVPLRGLDYKRLGQLSLPGGNIKSIARNAAYLAADAGGPVTMAQLLQAARMEADKLGRGLTPSELRGWPVRGTPRGTPRGTR